MADAIGLDEIVVPIVSIVKRERIIVKQNATKLILINVNGRLG